MSPNSGKVTLVGAGPGSPDLLTLRAVACLREADVVLHDRLIPPEILKTFAPQAKLVYVGKKASYHTLPQDEIADRLIAEARRGKNVVRLKGGDPYIFGRGGEEAERLYDAGIDFEVVPGVSSAFAAPLFAGIPLTHREFTPEIAIVTGHENPHKPGELPYHAGEEREASSWIHWPTLAKMGTIVFLMGMGNVRANMQKLIDNGLDPATPAAAIRWGSLGRQRSVFATVATLADAVQNAELKAPAVIVVGKVVGLASKLNWFEKKKFFGKTFLITRAVEDNVMLKQLIEKDSGTVIEWPSYEYAALKLDQKINVAIRRIDGFDWLVFTSVRAVKYFLAAYFKIHDDLRALANIKMAAVGAKTAAALRAEKLWVDVIAKDPSAASMARHKVFAQTKNLNIFLPQAADAREEFSAALVKQHKIFLAPLYRKKIIKHTREDRAALLKKKIDWVLFFSPSAEYAFIKSVGAERAVPLLKSAKLAVIGKTTAAHLKTLGLNAEVISHKATAEDAVKRIGSNMSSTCASR